MLKGISPLLNADLLHVLAAMGHGDELALVDANFPAASTAQRLVRLDGVDSTTAGAAILGLLPLDTFVDEPLIRMEPADQPSDVPPVQQEMLALAVAAENRQITMAGLSRLDFYERTKTAFAVVATGERRAYGCFILVKGVIFQDVGRIETT